MFANISGIDNIGAVLLNDAGGIGLFRSEFLYLENSDFPTEEQQFHAYKRVLESMAGKKVIIRTLDIGADKQVDYFGLKKEENPHSDFVPSASALPARRYSEHSSEPCSERPFTAISA